MKSEMNGLEVCLLLEDILIDPLQCQKLLFIESLEYYLPQVNFSLSSHSLS
jgi:hypothetical protein